MHPQQKDLIQILFVKARRWGIVNTDYNLELIDNFYKALCVASQSSKHWLYSRFPKKDIQLHTMVLRCCGHNFALPVIKTKYVSIPLLITLCLNIFNILSIYVNMFILLFIYKTWWVRDVIYIKGTRQNFNIVCSLAKISYVDFLKSWP